MHVKRIVHFLSSEAEIGYYINSIKGSDFICIVDETVSMGT